MKLYCIKTENCAYISFDGKMSPYIDFPIEDYLFDGKMAEKTNKRDWAKIKELPTVVQKLVPETCKRSGYKLKDGFPITENTPATLPVVDGWDTPDDDYIHFPKDKFEYFPLYEETLITTESSWENIEVEFVVLAEIKNFEFVSVNYGVKHRLIDEIEIHPALLQEKPCSLTADESFKIIRQHIKLNIDPKVAYMNDYSSSLTVYKHVELIDPMKMVPLFSKSKKPKVTYQKHDKWQVYSIGTDKGYSEIPKFSGKNLKDLEKNIKTYLNDLMKMINNPVKECPCCKGMGVIEGEKS